MIFSELGASIRRRWQNQPFRWPPTRVRYHKKRLRTNFIRIILDRIQIIFTVNVEPLIFICTLIPRRRHYSSCVNVLSPFQMRDVRSSCTLYTTHTEMASFSTVLHESIWLICECASRQISTFSHQMQSKKTDSTTSNLSFDAGEISKKHDSLICFSSRFILMEW